MRSKNAVKKLQKSYPPLKPQEPRKPEEPTEWCWEEHEHPLPFGQDVIPVQELLEEIKKIPKDAENLEILPSDYDNDHVLTYRMRVSNPRFEKEKVTYQKNLEVYQRRMAAYEKKMISYNKRYALYQANNTAYEEKLKKERIRELRSELQELTGKKA